MPKILFGTRRLRFEAQQITGERLSVQKAADGITAKMKELSDDPNVKMGRSRLNKYELGVVSEFKVLELMAICAYYGEILGREVNTEEIARYDPNNRRVTMTGAAPAIPA